MVSADEEGLCSHKRCSRAAGRRNLLYTCAETSTKERRLKTGPSKLKVERKIIQQCHVQHLLRLMISRVFCSVGNWAPVHFAQCLFQKYISALPLFSHLFLSRKSSIPVLMQFPRHELSNRQSSRTFYILDKVTQILHEGHFLGARTWTTAPLTYLQLLQILRAGGWN